MTLTESDAPICANHRNTQPPIISLTSETVIQELDEACSKWGAFVVTDHGLDETLLEQVVGIGHDFFALPVETKQTYNLQHHGAKWRGYMPLGGERSHGGEIRDYKEGLYMGDDHGVDDPHLGLPTFGTNVFPDSELPEMRTIFTTYHAKMKELGNRMMLLLSLSLGLDETYMEENVTRNEPVILPRMFRYLPQPPKKDDSAAQNSNNDDGGGDGSNNERPNWGIGRHSDYGLFTMILTDAPGLEFQHPIHATWHNVPHIPHGIVMNVGDVLDRLTSGRYVSAYHRACNRSRTEYRLSLPFFYDPSWDTKLQTLPIANVEGYDTPQRTVRWSNTKITCSFDGTVQYSEFLAKKVAKVFPDLVPERVWKSLHSTSLPSTRHALVVQTSPDVVYVNRVMELITTFYRTHTEIKPSHGIEHVTAVHRHSVKAINCHHDYSDDEDDDPAPSPPLSAWQSMEIQIASLLHDVDDRKYFPTHHHGTDKMKNAISILETASVPNKSHDVILDMINLVSCSENGNHIPDRIRRSKSYHLLIPRYSDRLEAVGAKGVVRCYQYNREHDRPLSSSGSPRARCADEVWTLATPERFDLYQGRGGTSTDMISHYYDKLLHISRFPPREIVRNSYLERMAMESSVELVEVCVRFGRTGVVDEEYIMDIARKIQS